MNFINQFMKRFFSFSMLLMLLTNSQADAGIPQAERKILKYDEAFAMEMVNVTPTANGANIDVRWNIADGHYMYKSKFKFYSKDENVQVSDVTLPAGIVKQDDYFGEIEVYKHDLAVTIPVKTSTTEQELTIIAKSQGCSKVNAMCYPPTRQKIHFTLPAGSLSNNTGDNEPVATPAATVEVKQATTAPNTVSEGATTANDDMEMSEQDQLADIMKNKSGWLVLLMFFGFGLALAFTPCVFPMIPILSGIIAGQGDDITTRKAFIMSSLYVLAMAITYSLAGVVAGVSGENIQIWFQNPWVLTAFAGVFVALALSMFGFYEIQLPGALQSKITEYSNKQEGGSYSGVIIMGLLSALIVGPCVAPPLMGALIYISQTGDPVLGGAALFALSMGMGIPLIAIGTSAGKFLPRAGGWMDSVKVFFGIMMLAIGIWMLERVVAPVIAMWLWAALLIFSGIYLGGLTPISESTTGWGRFRKASGLIAMLYGALIIIGASQGNEDIFMPLKNNHPIVVGGQAAPQHAQFKTVTSKAQLDEALAGAKSQGKPAIVDFYADWCIACKEYEKFTFTDAGVIKTMENFTLIQANVTDDNDDSQELMKSNDVIGPPAVLFINKQGEEVKRYRLIGFKEPVDFKAHLEKFLASNQ